MQQAGLGMNPSTNFQAETKLRIHFMQQWFSVSDPTMEEALHDMPLFRELARQGWGRRLPDESTILRFRHSLEKRKPAEQTLASVDGALVARGLLLKAGAGYQGALNWMPFVQTVLGQHRTCQYLLALAGKMRNFEG